MCILPIELLGDVENYSDEFGNVIIGKIHNKGKIIFEGHNAKIVSEGAEVASDSYIKVGTDVQLKLGKHVHFDTHCEITLGNNSTSDIGDNVWFNAFTTLYNWSGEGSLNIGKNCRFGRFNLIAVCPSDTIVIGEESLTARNVSIMSNDGHPIFDVATRDLINIKRHIKLDIGYHVWLGNGTTIMSACEIGQNSMIGAHSFVRNKKFPNNCVIAGNPPKVIRTDVAWNKAYVDSISDLNERFVGYTEL